MWFLKQLIFTNQSNKSPFQTAWNRLKRNRPAIGGLLIIFFSFVLGVLGYLITPDSTPDANNMTPEIALQSPGYTQKFLLIKKVQAAEKKDILSRMINGSELQHLWIPIREYHFENADVKVDLFRGEGVKTKSESYPLQQVLNGLPDKSNLFSPDKIEEMQKKIVHDHVVKKIYYLGTDTYGRDILSRLLIGVRVSLAVGFMAVAISLLLGTFLGSIAGYYGGKTDEAIILLINIIWAVPTLLLVFAITLVLGKGFWQIFVAVGLTMWVQVARIVRGQVMSIRNMEYIEAAQSLGFGRSRIIFRHVLPNTLGPVLVVAASNFATAILIEAGLSFLGIGVQPPTPSWGSMIRENYGFIISSNPILAIVPGIAIMIMVLAFNLLGNGLRDALDVKMKS